MTTTRAGANRHAAPAGHALGGRMLAATVLTGAAAGVGGVALTLLLHLIQHLAFGYTEDTFLVGVQRASRLRRVIAVALGGAIAGTGWWLHRRHTDAEQVSVTRAVRDTEPRLPVGHTLLDAVLQVVAVGAGASLGREGAPRQAGAAFGGWIAARLGVTVAQRRTLLACGAGAGLAAVYNVPLGGALFTLEILLCSLAPTDVVPAVITAGIATVVAWPALSDRPTYRVPATHLHAPLLVWAVLVGPVVGAFGVGFVRVMGRMRTHAPTGWRSAAAITIAFAALGALAIGYPALLGNGKGPAQLAFAGTMTLTLAGALVLLKPAATALCLGSGAIGGLLTPSLATGAALGVFTGRLWTMIWPGGGVLDYAVVGAAALLAVTQRAPVTAIALTIEFVHTGINLLVPMLIAVTLGTATAWLLDRTMAPIATARRSNPAGGAHEVERMPSSR